MTTPTIRDHCAALAGGVAYLLACIQHGSSDPATLQEIADRANTARDLLAAEPVGEGPSEEDLRWIFYYYCDRPEESMIWRKGGGFQDAARAILARWGCPATPPAPEIKELQWPASVAQGCHEAAAEAESGSPLQQLLVAAGDLLERARPAAPPAPLIDLAARLISESKPMDPEIAEVLTPEARWDLYEGPAAPVAPEPGHNSTHPRGFQCLTN